MSAAVGITLINGQPGDHLSSADRALHYGDGLFETIRCSEGLPRWWPLHLQRLQQGCERLRLPFGAYQALAAEVATLAHWQPRCIIKVIVTRGAGQRRGYRPTGQEQPTCIVSRYEWPAEPDAVPLRVGISNVQLGTNALLAGLKHLNRLEQVLAQLGRPEGLDEVLMLSSTQHVIGGSMSNVFFADESGLYTPDLRECGVAGVMRRLVLETARSSQISRAAARTMGSPARGAGSAAAMGCAAIAVRHVAPDELTGVREAFMTNVRWGLRSIGELNGRALRSDDYAQQLRRLIDGVSA